MQRSERFDSADRIITIGFWINAVLMIFKMAAGYWGHSVAVFGQIVSEGSDRMVAGEGPGWPGIFAQGFEKLYKHIGAGNKKQGGVE